MTTPAATPAAPMTYSSMLHIQANYEPKTIMLAMFLLGTQMILTSLIAMYSYINTQYDSSGNRISNRDSNYLLHIASLILGIALVVVSLLIYMKPTLVSDLGSKQENGRYSLASWGLWIVILCFGIAAFVMAILNTTAGISNRIPQNQGNKGKEMMDFVWIIAYLIAVLAFLLCFVSAFTDSGSLGNL